MRAIDADALTEDCKRYLGTLNPDKDGKECTRIHWLIGVLENAPTIEPETCEDVVNKHGSDENKIRARLGFCKYCHEDSDGYVTPLEKNCHAFVSCSPIDGWVLSMKYGAWRKDIPIRFCPMCGRKL